MIKNPVFGKIAALLDDQALERRMAAAIVLGALEVKEPAIVERITALLDSDIAPLQRHALAALAAAKSQKAVPKIIAQLSARDADVRAAAVEALVAMGDTVVPALRERLKAQGADKRALEGVLATVGGKDAFTALLSGLEVASDAEQAKAAAFAVRARVKEADGRERRTYLNHIEKFLEKESVKKSPHALVGGIKILGYLEDESAVPSLLAYATSAKQSDAVRQEAMLALRFCAGDAMKGKRLAEKLLDVAETAPAGVARTAMLTLAGVDMPSSLAERLGKLAADGDPEKAEIAIERLAVMKGREAANELASVGLRTKDKSRAERVYGALSKRDDGAEAVAGSLVVARDPDRAWMLAKIIRPQAKKLDKATTRSLISSAVDRLIAGERGWEAQLAVGRDADPGSALDALRGAADKLKKGSKLDRAASVYRVLARVEGSTLDDQYTLASLEIRTGRCDLDHGARDRAPALEICVHLAEKGFDLAGALRRDRALDLDQRYYVGFHLAEKRLAAGKEVLSDVAEAGGRSAIAKKAKSKLKSAGLSAN